MPIANSIADLQSLGIATSPAARSSDLAQEDFLALMVAQFQNQDPFKPMENGDFLGQLAQFGTVSGIDDLQTSFEQFAGRVNSDQALQASGLIGREVLIDSPTGFLSADGEMAGAVELAAANSNVVVDIKDASGQLIRSLPLGAQNAGLAEFNWDGTTDSGDLAAPGTYLMSARVQGASGFESVPVLARASVDSVSLDRAGAGLTLNVDGLGAIHMSNVRQIG